jgi:predicted adenine nucleotide alpha hydrolase (AANH) superfamily ATPase
MNNSKSRLLLQVCCAPDATVAVERLKDKYDLTLFFYNPNIHPENEYRKRALETQRLAPKLDVECIVYDYDAELWFELTRGMEKEPEKGRRCEICFRMRLLKTAQFAKEHGYDIFATVLTVSPHKNADLINRIGNQVAESVGVPYMESNFKKKDGFKRSLELSRQYRLFRQDYCGCLHSQRDREIQKSEQALRETME